jgi:hypothetical protein
LSRKGKLQKVPNDQGRCPGDEMMPLTFECLLVAGNEALPDSEDTNNWNGRRSSMFLAFYDDNYQTDDEGKELSSRSRDKIFRVAEKLGITNTQMNFSIQFL